MIFKYFWLEPTVIYFYITIVHNYKKIYWIILWFLFCNLTFFIVFCSSVFECLSWLTKLISWAVGLRPAKNAFRGVSGDFFHWIVLSEKFRFEFFSNWCYNFCFLCCLFKKLIPVIEKWANTSKHNRIWSYPTNQSQSN